jgi:hypothetical protein
MRIHTLTRATFLGTARAPHTPHLTLVVVAFKTLSKRSYVEINFKVKSVSLRFI